MMQNHWLKKHLNSSHREQSILDNYGPIVLTWNDIGNYEMPIIRENYVEVQTIWAVYMNEAENLERMESYGKCYSQIR